MDGLLIALIVAFSVTLSGIGAACLYAIMYGTNTVKHRGRGILVGLTVGLLTLIAQMHLGINGHQFL